MRENIYEQIEKVITDFLDLLKESYIKQEFSYTIEKGWRKENIYSFEAYGYHKNEYNPDKQTDFILLRLFVNDKLKQIYICNIYLPPFMRYNGIGKKIIHKLFVISDKEQYELYIIDMVNSFYERMIKRGALPCDGYSDAVKITKNTNLNS